MAPVSKARPPAANDLQQRVTALDRSTERFSIQIAEAYSLLNIDFDSARPTYSQADAEEEARVGFTPKEQWVLRWLLKKFEGDIVQLGGPCSEPKAWTLLRIVVTRLPLTVTARLLSAHKFMSTVQKILDWLCSYVVTYRPTASASDDEQIPTAPLSRESSSSTTVQEMPSIAGKKSKKRKRGQPESEFHAAEEVTVLDPVLLYTAICGVLSRVEAFTNDKPRETENFAVEHIKAAIKTPIEQGAKILGNSLQILAQIMIVPNNSLHTVNYDVFLRSTVDIWSLRSTFQENSDDSISAQAFSVHCLVPALRLLLRIQSTSFQDDGITSIAQATQNLIAAHVILPGRTAFMRAKNPDKDESQTSMIAELLGPLLKVVILEVQDVFPVTHESSIISTIPMFFEYALKLLPQDTPKQRINEAQWLRALFVQLAECLSLSFPLSKVSTPSEIVLDTLESLLHLLIKNNVSMDIQILESIVLYLSGIYPVEAHQRVKWSLVGLCMEICPDLAIPVRSNSNLRTGRATLQTEMVLERILAKLTDSGFKDGLEISSNYDTMLDTVVLRLVRSFINARDLLGFLKIWEQQIRLWETAKMLHVSSGRCSHLVISIWEDDALLQTISEQLEQALTAGQISKLLDDLGSRITNTSDALATNSLAPYAEVVVLDCALNGLRSDSVIQNCKTCIESTGRKLATVLNTDDALFVTHGWRIWRVLATMASQFSYYQDDLFRHAQEKIALSLAKGSNSTHFSPHHYEALFALRFLISVIEVQKPGNQTREFSEILCAVIRAFVESVPSVPPPDGKKDSSQWSYWDGKRESVTTRHTLLLACAAQLTSLPKVLSEIESSVLNLFLLMIYRRAAHSVSMSNTSKGINSANTSITFVDVWEELIEIGMVGEYPPITRAIRHIVYDAFVQTRPGGENRSRTEEEEYAVFVVSRMSLGAFEREQREHIIRHVSDELLKGTSLPDYSQYMALLIRSLDYPKKSMHLLCDPAYLWTVADLVDSGSEVPVSSSVLISFRQLATKAINIAISDCAESKSTSFLDPFLDHLNKRSLASAPEQVALAKSTLQAVSLKLLWRRYDALPEQLKGRSPSLVDMCQDLFEWLPRCLTQWEAGQEDWVLSVILDALETCLAMLESGISKTVSEIQKSSALSQISQISEWSKTLIVRKGLPPMSLNTTIYSLEDLVIAAKKIEASISPHGPVMTTMVNIAAIEEFTTVQARQAWTRYLADSLWKLDDQKQANQITQLTNMDFTNESTLHYVRRLLNHTYEKTPPLKSALAQLFSKICTHLHQPASLRSRILGLHSLDLLLKKNPWTISQWHIDSLLATITILTARSHTPPAPIAPSVFTSLCRLLGTALALHRPKLGGRFHLLVPALQGLLHPLFTPYTYTSPSPAVPLPPALIPTHATAYARLLTSLCDPSVSAATHTKHPRRAALNDATKTARALAGQHLQYLLMEFCACQLQGRLSPEVRRALDPGLYALFGAMGPEVLRTVNAALGGAGRAVFKVLYEDWRRFGRWRGG